MDVRARRYAEAQQIGGEPEVKSRWRKCEEVRPQTVEEAFEVAASEADSLR